MRFYRLPIVAVSLAILCQPLIGAQTASAVELISRTPTVHIAVTGVESQAQLANQLRSQGFSDIVLSAIYPSPMNPHPETDSASTSHPEQTPVHSGWNGIAVKEGQVVQVFVDQ